MVFKSMNYPSNMMNKLQLFQATIVTVFGNPRVKFRGGFHIGTAIPVLMLSDETEILLHFMSTFRVRNHFDWCSTYLVRGQNLELPLQGQMTKKESWSSLKITDVRHTFKLLGWLIHAKGLFWTTAYRRSDLR